jgi:hypothetical protein
MGSYLVGCRITLHPEPGHFGWYQCTLPDDYGLGSRVWVCDDISCIGSPGSHLEFGCTIVLDVCENVSQGFPSLSFIGMVIEPFPVMGRCRRCDAPSKPSQERSPIQFQISVHYSR